MAESVLSEDIRLQRMQTEEKLFPTNEKYEQYTWLEKKKKKKTDISLFFLIWCSPRIQSPRKAGQVKTDNWPDAVWWNKQKI